ncbi:hypothetical protein H4W81_005214 [Nonomuraea africana]|uniref:Uncharacterized protein n=1 Tax=Nonomuraea africana TaxID=46171 RepID=A0ABR9KKD5_9ACTN|nr:hypothetical protein [Nonomuraea africana]
MAHSASGARSRSRRFGRVVRRGTSGHAPQSCAAPGCSGSGAGAGATVRSSRPSMGRPDSSIRRSDPSETRESASSPRRSDPWRGGSVAAPGSAATPSLRSALCPRSTATRFLWSASYPGSTATCWPAPCPDSVVAASRRSASRPGSVATRSRWSASCPHSLVARFRWSALWPVLSRWSVGPEGVGSSVDPLGLGCGSRVAVGVAGGSAGADHGGRWEGSKRQMGPSSSGSRDCERFLRREAGRARSATPLGMRDQAP